MLKTVTNPGNYHNFSDQNISSGFILLYTNYKNYALYMDLWKRCLWKACSFAASELQTLTSQQEPDWKKPIQATPSDVEK